MIIVPGPLCWNTLSEAPLRAAAVDRHHLAGRRALQRRRVLADVLPPDVAQRAGAAAVNAVGGGVAEDHVLQRAAVARSGTSGPGPRSGRCRRARPAGEALHAAVVGAADVDRRADRLAAVRGRPGAEGRRRAAAAARRAAAAARRAASARRAAASARRHRAPVVPPRRPRRRRAGRAAAPARQPPRAPVVRPLPPAAPDTAPTRPSPPRRPPRRPSPPAPSRAPRPAWSRPRRSIPAVAVDARRVRARSPPAAPSCRRCAVSRRPGGARPCRCYRPRPDRVRIDRRRRSHTPIPPLARISRETTEPRPRRGTMAHDTVPPGGCSGLCRPRPPGRSRDRHALFLRALSWHDISMPRPTVLHDAPQPAVGRRGAVRSCQTMWTVAPANASSGILSSCSRQALRDRPRDDLAQRGDVVGRREDRRHQQEVRARATRRCG